MIYLPLTYIIALNLEPVYYFFFFNDTATTEIYTLSLHDALPISLWRVGPAPDGPRPDRRQAPRCQACLRDHVHRRRHRSEEHTSELQSPCNLVCRLLLEKKKKKNIITQ